MFGDHANKFNLAGTKTSAGKQISREDGGDGGQVRLRRETKELRNFHLHPGLKPPTSTHCNHIKIHWWPTLALPIPRLPPRNGLLTREI